MFPAVSLRRYLILLAIFASFPSSCVPTTATIEPHPPVHLQIAGSTSMQSLMEALTRLMVHGMNT